MDSKTIAIISLILTGALLLIAVISYSEAQREKKRLAAICTCHGGTMPCDCSDSYGPTNYTQTYTPSANQGFTTV